MSVKPSLDGSSDYLKNEEAQKILPKRTYLCLTMFTCFCPAQPINIVALIFSLLAQRSYVEKDGSRRLGGKVLHLAFGVIS